MREVTSGSEIRDQIKILYEYDFNKTGITAEPINVIRGKCKRLIRLRSHGRDCTFKYAQNAL